MGLKKNIKNSINAESFHDQIIQWRERIDQLTLKGKKIDIAKRKFFNHLLSNLKKQVESLKNLYDSSSADQDIVFEKIQHLNLALKITERKYLRKY